MNMSIAVSAKLVADAVAGAGAAAAAGGDGGGDFCFVFAVVAMVVLATSAWTQQPVSPELFSHQCGPFQQATGQSTALGNFAEVAPMQTRARGAEWVNRGSQEISGVY